MLTFDALCSAYLRSLEGRPSARRYRQVYRQYFEQSWGGILARSISRLQVIKLRQAQHPEEQLRKALSLVRQMYNWAGRTINPETDDLYYGGPNPAEGLQLAKAPSRERMATLDELRRILTELPYLHPRHAAFFAVRLTVPSRIKELREAGPTQWTRCELIPGRHGALWHKSTTKNGLKQIVYVAPQALQYLDALPWSGRYFFPGAYGNHWGEDAASVAWGRFMAALEIRDLQLLDVRRTLASYLYRLHRRQEVDDLTIKALLNHYDGRPVAVYTRLDVEYLAPILQSYADWLWRLSHPLASPVPLTPPATRRATDHAVLSCR